MEEIIFHIASSNFLIPVSLHDEDNCLPLCEEIYYDSTISSAKFPASSGEAYYYLSKNLAKKLQEIYIGYFLTNLGNFLMKPLILLGLNLQEKPYKCQYLLL